MTLRVACAIFVAIALCAPAEVPSAQVSSAQLSNVQILGAISPRDGNPSDVPAGNPLWSIPLKDLSATRDRPIFSPSRRPPVTAAPVRELVAPKKTEPDRPQLTLVGTVVGEQEAIGVFLDETTKAAVRLKTGEDHDGWVLQSVQAREVTFQKNRKTAVLTLPQSPGSQATAVPEPATSPPTHHRRFNYGQ
jgi:hypothetical protein